MTSEQLLDLPAEVVPYLSKDVLIRLYSEATEIPVHAITSVDFEEYQVNKIAIEGKTNQLPKVYSTVSGCMFLPGTLQRAF